MTNGGSLLDMVLIIDYSKFKGQLSNVRLQTYVTYGKYYRVWRRLQALEDRFLIVIGLMQHQIAMDALQPADSIFQ